MELPRARGRGRGLGRRGRELLPVEEPMVGRSREAWGWPQQGQQKEEQLVSSVELYELFVLVSHWLNEWLGEEVA